MVDKIADVGSSLQDAVQLLFKDLKIQRPSTGGDGEQTQLMTHIIKVLKQEGGADPRRALEEEVETDPACSATLIRVLVQELEKRLKVVETRAYVQVIPLLLTLYSVVLQSGAPVPACLHRDLLGCLTRCLSLPLPYAAVAKRVLRSVRAEVTTPGSLCLRRVTVEQNLVQERVFVLADPAVFSAPLEAAARSFLESDPSRDAAAVHRVLVLRVLQAALGPGCDGRGVTRALQALGDRAVEQRFQEVVAAVEQSLQLGADGYAAYVSALEQIHTELLAARTQGGDASSAPTGGDGSLLPALPRPRIIFCLWKDEKNLSKLLEKFALISSSSVDREENDSVTSRDSGIERDLKDREAEKMEQRPVRKATWSRTWDPGDARKRLTARVVAMGDDRVLGRLARAYHGLRKKETKRLTLTKKLDMEFYYVPVTAVEPWHRSATSPRQDRLALTLFLERLDPWYKLNVSSLGANISCLPLTVTAGDGADVQTGRRDASGPKRHLLDTLCYYLRCGTQPLHLPIYCVKMTRCHGDATTTVDEDVFVSHLEAEMPEFTHLRHKPDSGGRKPRRQTVAAFGGVITVSYTAATLSKRQVTKGEARMTCGLVITSEPAAAGAGFLSVTFDSMTPQVNTKIQARSITIKTMEHRTLSVCLDRDLRRTFTDVQRMEVAPCPDPRCSVRLSKYLDKVLPLPINTFCGFSP